MYCRKCGAQIPDDSLFCSKCGCRLAVEQNSGGAEDKASDHAKSYGSGGTLSDFRPSGDRMADIRRLQSERKGMSFAQAKAMVDELYSKNNVEAPRKDTAAGTQTSVSSGANNMLAKSVLLSEFVGDVRISTKGCSGWLELNEDRLIFKGEYMPYSSKEPPEHTYMLSTIRSITPEGILRGQAM